jgi:hypothetical protein
VTAPGFDVTSAYVLLPPVTPSPGSTRVEERVEVSWQESYQPANVTAVDAPVAVPVPVVVLTQQLPVNRSAFFFSSRCPP